MSEGTERISIVLHDLDLSIVDDLCQKAGFSRSAAIRVIVREWGTMDATRTRQGEV